MKAGLNIFTLSSESFIFCSLDHIMIMMMIVPLGIPVPLTGTALEIVSSDMTERVRRHEASIRMDRWVDR